MSEKIVISMPLFLEIGKIKKKRYYINLNGYRNWHYQVSNQLKKLYKEHAWQKIYKLKFNKKIKLEFVLWKINNQKIDRANVLSIHEKFFCDALVETKCIKDDNDQFIEQTIYRTGGINNVNPRVDIIITEIKEEYGSVDIFS